MDQADQYLRENAVVADQAGQDLRTYTVVVDPADQDLRENKVVVDQAGQDLQSMQLLWARRAHINEKHSCHGPDLSAGIPASMPLPAPGVPLDARGRTKQIF